MANTKNNQRFQATERRIEDAFVRLTKTTEPDRVTVRAVCAEAGVNRSTFYAHFVDIFDLADRLEERLSAELMGRFSDAAVQREVHPHRDGAPAAAEPVLLTAASLTPFCEHIATHRDFYRVALCSRTSFPLERGLERIWREVALPLSRRGGIEDETEVAYVLTSFQAGFTWVLRRWVDGGCAEPPERIAELLELCVPAVWRAAR